MRAAQPGARHSDETSQGLLRHTSPLAVGPERVAADSELDANEHHIADMQTAIERLTDELEQARRELRRAQSRTRKLNRALTRATRVAGAAQRRRERAETATRCLQRVRQAAAHPRVPRVVSPGPVCRRGLAPRRHASGGSTRRWLWAGD